MIDIRTSSDKHASCGSCNSTNDIRNISFWAPDGLKITIKLCSYCRRVLLTKIVEDFRA